MNLFNEFGGMSRDAALHLIDHKTTEERDFKSNQATPLIPNRSELTRI
jgi:hypothetical protein